ncbi:MAG: T9SS type A sorting domain-containing protein [Cytophagaceae bacterium]|nr:MAG: T9SS type A sorting domain-containing protein [Cytophagaceae bacterium]
MIKRFLFLGLASGLALATTAQAQTAVTLGTSPYVENFDNLGTALPAGFSVYTNATTTALGTAATPVLTPSATTAWSNTAGGFKNYASATALGAGAATAAQTAATNRALGVRQTGSFGDGTSTATPPTGVGPAFVFQVANTTGKSDFQLSYKLQSLDETSPRIASWQVSYGLGAAPTTFVNVGVIATTGDMTFSNNTVTADFATALDNNAGPVWIRVAALNPTTGSNNRPTSAIDDFSLSWNVITATTPNLVATPTALTFAGQNINTASAAQTYSLTGANLTANTTLTATGPFTVSKDNLTYATTVTYTPAELATAKTVYVKFTPTATGPFTGSISHASAGASTRTVALSGTGKDPNQTVFDFSACTSATTLSDGFTQYSVSGAQVWGCTTFGRDPAAPTGTTAAPYGVQMNGYASGNLANEDWLISPSFNLTAYNFPLLSFWSRTAFNGPALKLRVSTNYSGTGDPTLATWTDVSVQFPSVGSDTWTQSPSVNLSAYKQATVYVAFVYTSTTSAAARWSLDDIALTNSATPPTPLAFTDQSTVAFGYQAVNTNGDRPLTVAGSDLTGGVTLTSSNPVFTLSKDGVTFGTTLALTQAEVNAQSKAVTVRFRPTTPSTSYSASVAITTAGTTVPSVTLTGDTYDVANTLELVNWNIEWFGSTGAGLGPTDKVLQQANVTAGLTALKADVFALEEVVDTVRFRNVVAQLSANLGVPYKYKVSDFGSYADDAADTDYPGAQKLAFIYRSDLVTPTAFQGLLRCSQATGCAGYTPWASGRFPYMMSANVTLNGVTKAVNFIVIHAKANATATSPNDYARRQTGAQLLKNLLDTTYPTANTVVVGDYNDVLNGTIATGVTPAVSSYNNFVADAANYVSISLPLAQAGLQSTVSYKTVIDNVIANRNMANYYINGTAAIRTDVAGAITNYATTTSDHYPVFTRYSFANTTTATKNSSRVALGLYPNPVTNTVRFDVPETGSNLRLQVQTVDGRVVLQGSGSVEQLNQQLNQRVGTLGTGLYLIQVVGAQQTYTNRFVKQ